MALINQKTGYYGFTSDGLGGTPIDNHGRVNRVIFSIVYPNKVNDIEFTISNGTDDWGAQMGDGEIIPLRNPTILFQNRDNSIIQFDMDIPYPSNSPCILVYRSDSAWFNIKELATNRPWTVNTVSGHFGYTVEGYGGTPSGNGYVNRLLCSVPYPVQASDVEFTMSTDPSHWGARMGDGSLITLRDPVVIFSNRDNASIQFTMDTPYPSNSPCVLVYRSADAWFNVTVLTTEAAFVPVTGLTGVPATVVTGIAVDLSSVSVTPYNASKQGIEWSVISGPATVYGDTLLATNQGDIVLRATIVGGTDETTNFVKDFTVTASTNTITILSQPESFIPVVIGMIDTVIYVDAKSTGGTLSYKWYQNTVNSTNGGTPIGTSGSSPSYRIPITLAKGDYYYYCEISSPGAISIKTNTCRIRVSVKLTGIEITPRTATISLLEKRELKINQIPSDADAVDVVWTSSNPLVIQVDMYGEIFAVGDGTAVITANTIDGQFSNTLSLTVAAHIPVTIIGNTTSAIDTDTPTVLSGVVSPENATNKTITWSIINAGTTGAVLNGNTITATSIGSCIIRATIVKGAGVNTDYTQDIRIDVAQKFIPVTDVSLSFPSEIRVGDTLTITATIAPGNASYKVVALSVTSPGTTGATITNNILSTTAPGTVSIRATVVKGLSEISNYTKDFQLTILPKWISVESISGFPSIFTNVELPLQLDAVISPENATVKDITYTLKNPSKANATLDGSNKLHIDYQNITWWISNPNPTPPDYWDQWLENITDPIIVEVRIPNGIRMGEDFVLAINIGIKSPPPPSIHIPIDNVTLEFPSINRARRPILMDRVIKTPWNATTQDILVGFTRAATGAQGFSLAFRPNQESPEYWKENYNITLEEDYDWSLDCFYTYLFEDIMAAVKYSVVGGMPDGTTYQQTDNVPFLPEYIPVKNISNIPTSLPANTQIQLSPEIDTMFPVNNRSTEPYDLEIPSYSEIKWKIVSAGGTGATITNEGLLKVTAKGNLVIEAEVPQGTHEEYTWYEREFQAVSYKKQFTIQVTDQETAFHYPIVTLKLSNNKTVEVKKVNDFYNLCNILPSTASLTVGGETFRKDQVVDIKFWEEPIPYPPQVIKNILITSGLNGTQPTGKFSSAVAIGEARKFTAIALDEDGIPMRGGTLEWTATQTKGNGDITINSNTDGSSATLTTDNSKSKKGDTITVVVTYIPVADDKINGSSTTARIDVTVDEKDKVLGVEVTPTNLDVIKATTTKTETLTLTIHGSFTSTESDLLYKETDWELTGNNRSGTTLTPATNGKTATLKIDSGESIGTELSVTVTSTGDTDFEATATINIIDDPTVIMVPPPIISLKNFGRNFTNLTSIDRIPDTVSGKSCLEGFLMGCTSFNQSIEIPDDVTGERCLRNFLSGCTSFNQKVVIPEGVTGIQCLTRFLSDCTSFNQKIVIPNGVTGEQCLSRFLAGCKRFNQQIDIPSNVSGDRCLDHFIAGCEIFNKPITIPDNISGTASLRGFMRDTLKMTSTITIVSKAATNCEVNGLTLACFARDDAYDIGVPIAGTGAAAFKAKCINMITNIPLRNLK